MTTVVKTSAFKSGNSVAVRLPKTFGVKPGEGLEVVKRGSSIEIRIVCEAESERAKIARFVQKMRELGPTGGDPLDGRIEMPDRLGLS